MSLQRENCDNNDTVVDSQNLNYQTLYLSTERISLRTKPSVIALPYISRAADWYNDPYTRTLESKRAENAN